MEKLKKLRFAHVFVGFATLILLLELGGLAFELKYKDRFYPGVIIGGQAVGGKTYQEVVDHFKIQAETLAVSGLVVNVSAGKGDKKIIIPMSRTGLTPDTLVEYFSFGNMQGVVNQAYGFGRTGGAVRKFKERFSLIPTKEFNFPVTIYNEAIVSLAEQELKGFLAETVPARFVQKGVGVVIEGERVGEVLDMSEAIKVIDERLISLNALPIELAVKAQPPVTTASRLKPFDKLANELAQSATLVFRYNGHRWKVSGPTLVTWLVIKTEGEVGVDQGELKTFLDKNVVPVIDNPPQNSRFEMREGRLVEIVPGRAGKIVDVVKTIENVEQVVYGVQKSFAVNDNMIAAVAEARGPSEVIKAGGVIEVPVVTIDAEPAITKETIAQYSIKDLVGTARTSFKGSSDDRRNNITTGVSKLNGLLIAPGEEFSVVNSIGAISEAEGYAKEYVIKGGQSIKELGGGLCQISTTMFRAVLNAGLPVTERQNHRYVVGYYGPGLDATIYGPHPDLRFVNDTGNYILIQGKTEGNEVVFEFYGQKDGRTVALSEPEITDRINPPIAKFIPTYDLAPGDTKCTERARQGLTANALYSVTYPDGRVKEKNFRSVYVPWQEVCLIGVAK